MRHCASVTIANSFIVGKYRLLQQQPQRKKLVHCATSFVFFFREFAPHVAQLLDMRGHSKGILKSCRLSGEKRIIVMEYYDKKLALCICVKFSCVCKIVFILSCIFFSVLFDTFFMNDPIPLPSGPPLGLATRMQHPSTHRYSFEKWWKEKKGCG